MSQRACFLLVGFLGFQTASVTASDIRITPEAVRKAIDLHWRTIDHFLIESDQFVPGPGGGRKSGTTLSHYEFISGIAGEKRFRATENRPDGTERLLMDVREDGRHRVERLISSDDYQPYGFDTQTQKSHGHSWNGAEFAALWLVLPAGKTLAQHLDDGAKLSVSADGEMATLTFRQRGLEGDCELSGRHDWLAKSVTLKGAQSRWVVDSFGRVDGRWYPASGHFTAHGPLGPHATPFRFDVTKFRYRVRPDPRLFDFQDEGIAAEK